MRGGGKTGRCLGFLRIRQERPDTHKDREPDISGLELLARESLPTHPKLPESWPASNTYFHLLH